MALCSPPRCTACSSPLHTSLVTKPSTLASWCVEACTLPLLPSLASASRQGHTLWLVQVEGSIAFLDRPRLRYPLPQDATASSRSDRERAATEVVTACEAVSPTLLLHLWKLWDGPCTYEARDRQRALRAEQAERRAERAQRRLQGERRTAAHERKLAAHRQVVAAKRAQRKAERKAAREERAAKQAAAAEQAAKEAADAGEADDEAGEGEGEGEGDGDGDGEGSDSKAGTARTDKEGGGSGAGAGAGAGADGNEGSDGGGDDDDGDDDDDKRIAAEAGKKSGSVAMKTKPDADPMVSALSALAPDDASDSEGDEGPDEPDPVFSDVSDVTDDTVEDVALAEDDPGVRQNDAATAVALVSVLQDAIEHIFVGTCCCQPDACLLLALSARVWCTNDHVPGLLLVLTGVLGFNTLLYVWDQCLMVDFETVVPQVAACCLFVLRKHLKKCKTVQTLLQNAVYQFGMM